jgi:hypothetical protein
MFLRTILLATVIAHAAAFSGCAPRLARCTPKPSTITARLGALSGDVSQRLDVKRGRICETTTGGKQVYRSKRFTTNALGEYDDALEIALAEIEELPTWYLIEAERSYRENQFDAEDASY